MAVSISAVSKEYVHVPVSASVELNTQTVEFAFLTTGTPDGATTWTAAAWEGSPANTRTARLLIGPATAMPLAAGSYTVWVRITDVTETPVRQAGSITII